MKRLLSLLLAIMLVLPAVALAADIDVTALSDTELEALYDAILAERLARRTFTSFEVQPGMYRVGVDVPAGAFRAVLVDGSDMAYIFTYEGDSNVNRHSYGLECGSPSEIGRMLLFEGDTLMVKYGVVRFCSETGGIKFE